MECLLCGHHKTQKNGKMPNGHQRYYCPNCHKTFSEKFNTLYYWRKVNEEQVKQVLQAYNEGCGLRGTSRLTKLAYGTVVRIVREASTKAQLLHNHQVGSVEIFEVSDARNAIICPKSASITPTL
jgi:transposase-like protein